MGWERIADPEQTNLSSSKASIRRFSKLIGPELQNEIPSYSRDIASAWQVVELLHLNPECKWYIYNGGREWVVQFSQNQGKEFEARSHTVMLGICYVALQSVIGS
jgi:hypothetical protein